VRSARTILPVSASCCRNSRNLDDACHAFAAEKAAYGLRALCFEAYQSVAKIIESLRELPLTIFGKDGMGDRPGDDRKLAGPGAWAASRLGRLTGIGRNHSRSWLRLALSLQRGVPSSNECQYSPAVLVIANFSRVHDPRAGKAVPAADLRPGVSVTAFRLQARFRSDRVQARTTRSWS
jgi:hypothetical protein